MTSNEDLGVSASLSRTIMTELVLPPHANAVGTAFGGTVLGWIDVCAGIAAQRHCGRVAVTAAIDEMQFLAPIQVGDVVQLEGQVNAAFGTSVEVGVIVKREGVGSVKRQLCADAKLTFVNIGDDGKPTPVPKLRCDSKEEEERRDQAIRRKKDRMSKRHSQST